MCYMILIADCNWSAMTVMLYNSAVVTAVVIVGLHTIVIVLYKSINIIKLILKYVKNCTANKNVEVLGITF